MIRESIDAPLRLGPPSGPRRMSSAGRALAVFGGAAVMFVAGTLTLLASRRASEDRELVTHTHAVLEATNATLSAVQDAETGQRGYLLSGDPAYLGPYDAALAVIGAKATSLRSLTHDNPAQQARLDELDRLVASKLAELRHTIDLRRTSGLPAATAVVRTNVGRATMDSIRAVLAAVRDEEDRLLAERGLTAARSERYALVVLILGTFAAIACALLLNSTLERYAERQAESAKVLAEQNDQLGEQAAELEAQAEQLQEQATELEIANEHLSEQMHLAEAANAAKSDFLAAVSHELRTPLNAIDGYTELLLLGIRGELSTEQQSDISRIKKSSRHLLTLINQVLNLAKVESGQMDLVPEIIPVVTLLQDAEELIRPQMDAKGIAFSIEPCQAATVAYADSSRARQILLNLLANAQKFTDSGGTVHLACDCSPNEGRVSIIVTDTGRGIPAAKLTEIFEPFTQLDRLKTPDAHRGIGLGLSISRTLARAMGGDLTVVSEPGTGSTFTLTLPTSPP
jgi:signal transduction histidine kinase